MKKSVALSLLALLALLAPRADALTCTFGAVTGVSFGAYDVFGAGPTKAVGSITYSCRNVNKANLMTMDLSTGSSGTFANRTLRSGANVLTYNLYSTAANTQVWETARGRRTTSWSTRRTGTPTRSRSTGRFPRVRTSLSGPTPIRSP